MQILRFHEFLNESVREDDLVKQIQAVLTPDLLKGNWRNNDDPTRSPMYGQCYAATSSLWYMLGAMNSGYTPYVLSHRNFPELFKNGESHWYLMNKQGHVLDVTADQFNGYPIDYTKGIANGMMVHPAGGDKRTKTIISRVLARQETKPF